MPKSERLTREQVEAFRIRLGTSQDAQFRTYGKDLCDMALEALDAGWVSVEERMPEDGTDCLVVVRGINDETFTDRDTWQMQRECPVGFSHHTIETGLGWTDYDFEDVMYWREIPAAPSASPQPPVSEAKT